MTRRTRIKISVPIIVKEKKSEEETPTISPLQVTDYGSSSITTEFSVDTVEAEEVVKGVLCGKINPPTFDNADHRLLYGKGAVNLTFAGLDNNTEYYLCPYALSNLGYKYGDIVLQRTKSSPIPVEYQLVEYLETNGSQWFDTNVISAISQEIEMKWQTYNFSNTCLYGASNRGDANMRFFTSVGALYIAHGAQREEQNNILVSYTDYVTIHTHNSIYLNSTPLITSTGKNYDYNTTKIFKDPFRDTYTFRGKVYYILIKLENNYVRKLYPVYRKSDNKPGMYDIITKQLYVNQGTGEFVVGPDKEWEE